MVVQQGEEYAAAVEQPPGVEAGEGLGRTGGGWYQDQVVGHPRVEHRVFHCRHVRLSLTNLRSLLETSTAPQMQRKTAW